MAKRYPRPRERLFAQPVLPLLMARGGVLDAHLGDCHLGHVDQRAHSGFPRHGRHGYARLEVSGGHGHTEVDPAAAADGAINIPGSRRSPTTTWRGRLGGTPPVHHRAAPWREPETLDRGAGRRQCVRPTPIGRLPRLPISMRHLPCTLPPRARQLPDHI
jgi:hypothetical protein